MFQVLYGSDLGSLHQAMLPRGILRQRNQRQNEESPFEGVVARSSHSSVDLQFPNFEIPNAMARPSLTDIARYKTFGFV